MTDCDAGETLSEKSGEGVVTVRLAVAEWVSAPLIPVIVSDTVPAGVVLVVFTVSVEVPAGAGLGEKIQEAPAGNPLQVRLATPLKPPLATMETVKVVEAPAATVCDAGETLSEKSGVGGGCATVSVAFGPGVSVTPVAPNAPEGPVIWIV